MLPVWSGAISFGLVTSLNYEMRPTRERPFRAQSSFTPLARATNWFGEPE
ncbi:hypothetical protein DSC45_35165 [Streptomyces sp. YIM 130001]|nr:hypothetical protein DSC45_35165 [Streptomyces sp. YIM 130001]